jgi:hypothetical protein
MFRIVRFGAAFLFALLLSLPASAHSRFFFGFGFPLFYDPYPYYPAYYYPPPVYYAPPPVTYAPPPAYYYVPAPATVPANYCRRFNGDATDDDTGAPFYGTACLLPDGKWHIVSY